MTRDLPPYYVRLRRLAIVASAVAVLAVAFVVAALAYCAGAPECWPVIP